MVRSTSFRARSRTLAPSLTFAHQSIGTPTPGVPSHRAPKHAPTSALRDADHPPAFMASRTASGKPPWPWPLHDVSRRRDRLEVSLPSPATRRMGKRNELGRPQLTVTALYRPPQ